MTANLSTLEIQLHHAAVYAQEAIDAMPDDLPVDIELERIASASAPAFAIAEEMIVLPARNAIDRTIRARAEAWIEGRYWN